MTEFSPETRLSDDSKDDFETRILELLYQIDAKNNIQDKPIDFIDTRFHESHPGIRTQRVIDRIDMLFENINSSNKKWHELAEGLADEDRINLAAHGTSIGKFFYETALWSLPFEDYLEEYDDSAYAELVLEVPEKIKIKLWASGWVDRPMDSDAADDEYGIKFFVDIINLG